MKVLADVPSHYKEAMCVFMALRRLGFPSENIFVVRAEQDPIPSPLLGVALCWRGIEFVTGVAVYEGTSEQLAEEWLQVCRVIGEASEEELREMYESSNFSSYENRARFVTGMMAKGIHPMSATLN